MRTLTLSLTTIILLFAPVSARGGDWSILEANSSSQSVQNARANAYHLSRMRSREMILRFYRAGYLVRVPNRTRFYYLDAIPPAFRYVRPWTFLFLNRLSREYYDKFGQPLRVTSLIRTVRSQRRLTHRNSNAAEATGPDRSSHLTGATLDISKRFMPAGGEQWMRRELFRLKQSGCLYAIEEFHQPTFHVMVYPNYRQYVARATQRAPEMAPERAGLR
ncbi:MAG: hypothetical protein KGL59_15860 [Acidobacteriota bacterium]|nr:hypothetical protein [Acidobacteriota bacterium]